MPDRVAAVEYIALFVSLLGVDRRSTEVKFTTEQRMFIVKSFARKKLKEMYP
jgi:hypothetical protein